MRRRFAVLAVVSLSMAAACSSGHHPVAQPTTTTAPDPNPYVVPAVITPAYVNAVFKVLEHVDGNASRTLIAAKAVSPTVLADIRAIYADPLYADEVNIAEESLKGDLKNIRRPPGDVAMSVVRLISASPSCIFVEAASDYSAVVYRSPTPPASEYWGLRLKQRGDDPGHLNPTPWAFSFNRTFGAPTSIPDQCVGQ